MPSPLIAPITRVPSRPRLMRPLFSVRHSPRLTNRNGVLARMAPPSTASGTPHHPSASISRGPLLEDAKPPVQGLAGQDDQEDDSPHEPNPNTVFSNRPQVTAQAKNPKTRPQ